jgi:hypothetical protein
MLKNFLHLFSPKETKQKATEFQIHVEGQLKPLVFTSEELNQEDILKKITEI